MMERQRTEISAELLAAVRELAEVQGRSEAEVLEEAVAGYLSTLRRKGTLDERLGVPGLDVVSGNRHLLEGGPFLVHAGDPYYPRRAGRVRVLSPRGFWEEALRPVR